MRSRFVIFTFTALLLLTSVATPVGAVSQPDSTSTSASISHSTTPAPSLKPKATVQPSALASEKVSGFQPTGVLSEGDLGGPDPRINQSSDRGTKQDEKPQARTATSKSFDIGGGVTETRQYLGRVHFQQNGQWQEIDSKLAEDANPTDSDNLLVQGWNNLKNVVSQLDTYQTRANDWQARFAPSDHSVGMVRINAGGKKLTFRPKSAQNGIKPVTTLRDGQQVVTYTELWPGVDVEYIVGNDEVKENIILKNSEAPTEFAFNVSGVDLIANTKGGFDIAGTQQTLEPLTVLSSKGAPVSSTPASQTLDGNIVHISLNANWFNNQPASSFPVTIDPTWSNNYPINGNFVAYKSDGTSCTQPTCYLNSGQLNDGSGYKTWRSVFQIDNSWLVGKSIQGAQLILNRATGTTENLWYTMHHASCVGYNCIDSGSPSGAAWFGQSGTLDVGSAVSTRIAMGEYNSNWILTGEERNPPYYTFKGFNTSTSYMRFYYSSAPGQATAISPATGQVVVTDQPQLKVNPASDPEGETVRYRFEVSAGGMSFMSPWLTSTTQYTVPEGYLQDGVTYTWRVSTYDGYTVTSANWSRTFKVDLRNGQDPAATLDDGGPVDVNLATGNVTTGITSHNIGALGGSMGLNLTYNSPYRNKPGLLGEYYNTNDLTGAIAVSRVDAGVDFDWAAVSPSVGVLNADNISARWTGYFVAPAAGTYTFGRDSDDGLRYWINNGPEQGSWTSGGTDYGTSYAFAPGEVVSVKVEYRELTGSARAKFMLRRPGQSDIPIPADMLRTAPRQLTTSSGLQGKYFYDSGSHVFPADTNAFLQRRETAVDFVWGTGAPVANGPTENWMTRYTGYFTAPVTGNYQFGTTSDDGSRVYLDGSGTPYLNDWVNSATNTTWGSDRYITAGQSVYIDAQFYEATGDATFALKVRGAVAEQAIPAVWLNTRLDSLPAGWALSVDADGDLAYEFANIQATAVILTDASGDTHTYQWTNTAYTPPAGESGNLVRNLDGTLTLTDADGRTYLFDTAGRITSVATPTDDRSPVALKYEYTGSPARLSIIKDGIDNTRSGTLYYSGASQCGTPPSGYSAAPANMLCAYVTTDSRTTYFYYDASGRLGRVTTPGDQATSFGYDSLGRLTSQRSALAHDAVAASIRPDNASVLSEITYDTLGRAADITLPSAQNNGFRAVHRYQYLPNETRTTEVGETEPLGYSQRVEYDTLYRTTKSYDKAGLATTTEWHSVKDLTLAATDATGLKSTTIYDYADRPTDQYGPAPAAWFDAATRLPLSGYTSQTPRSQSTYDEGIMSLEAAFYNEDPATKTLTGAPKKHQTGLNPADKGIYAIWGTNWPGYGIGQPITPDAGKGWGVRVTGWVRLYQTGIYKWRAFADDGFALYIDDQLVTSDWRDTGYRQFADANYTNTGDSWHRIRIEKYTAPGTLNDARLDLCVTRPDAYYDCAIQNWGWSPGYGLATTNKTYGAPTSTGTTITATSTTNYGALPELGLVASTSQDPSGLNLTATANYEPYQQAGSYLRQTSSALPGGATTNYSYYGPTEARANPCDGGSPAVSQAGQLKFKTDPDPDGAGTQTPRTTESIYDAAGRIVATHYNSDPWTCTSYDARDRVTQTVIPAQGSETGRTVTNDYQVSGNPLVTASSDSSGTITVTSDLLGRTTSYTDAYGNTTTSTYDNAGHLTNRAGSLGNEEYIYDSYDRLTDQKLDGTVYAHLTYDTYSRIASVTYPGSQTLTLTRESTTTGLGRLTGKSYTTPSGTYADSVTRALTGDITSGTELGQSKTYQYDATGRLTQSTIAGTSFTYAFGAQDASCASLPGTNANAGKSSNRTAQTIAGASTTYCYDQADRLIASSNPNYTAAQYDAHGNTRFLGNETPTSANTAFPYDSSDRLLQLTQTQTAQPTKADLYSYDVQSRLKYRNVQTNWVTQSTQHYGYTGSGDTPDFLRDNAWTITEKYLSLPGDVLLTIRPQATTPADKTYSLTNIHSDTMATTSATGSVLSTHLTGPFGEALTSYPTTPTNASVNGATFQYVGANEKLTEGDLVIRPTHMGARTYLPLIGRFAQVDPVQGGTPNSYVYPTDPVNDFDLTGTWNPKDFLKNNWQTIAVGAAIGFGCAATAGIGCAIAVGAAAGATVGGGSYLYNHRNDGVSVGGLAKAAGLGAISGGLSGAAGFGVGRLLGKAAFNSGMLGKQSSKFGSTAFGKTSGSWNRYGSKYKIGWDKHAKSNVFRIGIGKKSYYNNRLARNITVSKLHINILRIMH